jgi:hypothetical protein
VKSIPEHSHLEVDRIIKKFNLETFGKNRRCYVARIKGRYMYLSLSDGINVSLMCRLTYTGKMDGWEFAISMRSDEKYDAEKLTFPGSDYLDGTIVGAMKAALEAFEGRKTK